MIPLPIVELACPAAHGSSINLDARATINKLDLDASSIISGDGLIKKANVNADGISFSKKPVLLNIGPNVLATIAGELFFGPDEFVPLGSENGGNTASTVTVAGVRMSAPGKVFYPVDLSSLPDTTMLRGIFFKTNALACKLLLTGIQAPTIGTISLGSGLFYKGGNVTVTVTELIGDAFDEGGGNISLGTMRQLFGAYVKVSGSLSGTGEYAGLTPYELPVIVTLLPGSTPVPEKNDWFTVTRETTNLSDGSGITTAKIKLGMNVEKISEIGMTNILTAILGRLPDKVKVGSGLQWYSLDGEKAFIAAELGKLASIPDGGWADVTLDDLVGKSIFVTNISGSTSVGITEIRIVR